MILAVLDTNILVSALLARKGNQARAIRAVAQGLLRPAFSDPIVAEYRSVLARPKFHPHQADAAELLDLIEARGHSFFPPPSPISSPDPDDTMFIACAFEARADFLVTGNRRHFPAPRYGTTEVVNAAELLRPLILTP